MSNSKGPTSTAVMALIRALLICAAFIPQRAQAQASIDLGGGVFHWNMANANEDGRPDYLRGQPGPGWSLALSYTGRPDSGYVGGFVALIFEQREFDVHYAGGGLGGGHEGEEFVRQSTFFLKTGLNVRCDERSHWWFRPSIALCVGFDGRASGWSQGWRMGQGNLPKNEYYNQPTHAYLTFGFLGVGVGYTTRLSERLLLDIEPNVAQSLAFRPNDRPLGRVQYQAGVRCSVGWAIKRSATERWRGSWQRDRERRVNSRQ